MKSRRTRVIAAAAAAALATALSGCGGDAGQPGAAAIVDGKAITTEHLNTIVDAECRYLDALKAENPQVQPVALADLRFQVLSFMIGAQIVETDVKARGLTVRAGDVGEAMPDLPPVKGVSAADRAAMDELLHTVAENQVATSLLSAHLLDPKVKSSAQAAPGQTNQRYIANLYGRADVQVNPRYGEWTRSGVDPAGGELSVPGSQVALAAQQRRDKPMDTSSLPPSQKCGG